MIAQNVRATNTDSHGLPFSPEVVAAVWAKAQRIPGYALHRRDVCGARIARTEFGRETEHGWVIDHIKPVSKGGTDDPDNLQPLHWENNNSKADDWPYWVGTNDGLDQPHKVKVL